MSSHSFRLVEVTSPGAEPLTLDEVKMHLRVDGDADDAAISALIAVARQSCESFTGRALITRSYSLYFDAWPACKEVVLPKSPLLSVTQVCTYGVDNVAIEFLPAAYFVDIAGAPGRIVLAPGSSPPFPGRAASGIEIRFKAGYGAAPEAVPAALRHGMKQMIAHLYERRGDMPDSALQASGAALSFQPYRMLGL
jgi:uncharacterized phiE125 gp8 family phage protein